MRIRDHQNWMFTQALEMLDQAERLQRQFFAPGPAGASAPTWQPPVDIIETDHEFWILVALPGVAS